MSPRQPMPGPAFAVLPAVIALLALLNLHLPYLLVLPGPVEETTALVSIEGSPTHPPTGKLYLTTVVLGPTDRRLLVADYLRAKLEPSWEVVPFEVYYPPQRTPEQVDQANKADIEDSKSTATTAALDLLGYRQDVTGAGVLIDRVQEGFPAASVLRTGDLIVAANGQRVCSPVELVLALRDHPAGSPVGMTVWRDGAPRDLSVGTAVHPEEQRTVVGVDVVRAPSNAPVKVSIDSRNIGGPSAGLLFALAVTELLDQEDLTRGRTIAGTGTITCDGRVGAVGGLAQKIASAEREEAALFLVPAPELRDACRLTRTLPVAGVSTLADAVSALRHGPAEGMSCTTLAGGRRS